MTRAWVLVLGAGLVGCAPGYIKSSDLEAREQGPAACNKSCKELGMRMTALVLVGDQQPGCVCQPLITEGAPAPAAATTEQGAAASTTGFVVIAAAAAAQRQAELERQQQLELERQEREQLERRRREQQKKSI